IFRTLSGTGTEELTPASHAGDHGFESHHSRQTCIGAESDESERPDIGEWDFIENESSQSNQCPSLLSFLEYASKVLHHPHVHSLFVVQDRQMATVRRRVNITRVNAQTLP